MGNKHKNGEPLPIQVTIDGRVVNYNSHAQAARAHNVKPGTFSLRLKKGWSIQQALGLADPPMNANVPHYIQVTIGSRVVNYTSHAQAARAHNIKPGVFSRRLKKRWFIRQALGLADPPKNSNVVKVAKFSSISAAARAHGIKPHIVHSRLRRGWSLEQALDVPKNTRGRKVCVTEGDGRISVFDSVSEAARHYHLQPNIVLQRIRTYGWSPEQALELVKPPPNAGIPKPVTVGNVKYASLKEAVDFHGLNYDVVKQRKNKLGWTLDQAFELEPPPRHAKGCLGYVYLIVNKKNKKVYVGQTKTTVEERWRLHIKSALSGKKVTMGSLHEAIKKYGPRSFECKTLEAATTIDQLNRLERKYIDEYKARNPRHGYNTTHGGSGLTGGNKVTVRGKRYDSLSAAARAFKVKPALAHQRVKVNGWTVEQALGLAPRPAEAGGPKEVVVSENGKELRFESYAAAARHYGVPYKKFHNRLRKGWSIGKALEIK